MKETVIFRVVKETVTYRSLDGMDHQVEFDPEGVSKWWSKLDENNGSVVFMVYDDLYLDYEYRNVGLPFFHPNRGIHKPSRQWFQLSKLAAYKWIENFGGWIQVPYHLQKWYIKEMEGDGRNDM